MAFSVILSSREGMSEEILIPLRVVNNDIFIVTEGETGAQSCSVGEDSTGDRCVKDGGLRLARVS